MRVPDWVLLYFKLHAKLPDQEWQTLLNLSRLGKSNNSLNKRRIWTLGAFYKALCLLLNKGGNEDFHLGGKGYDLEFCALCDAIRACTTHGAGPDETCIDGLRSKA
ncbi:hypothetical protein ACROYT_G019716 [Oculina patagonica]